MKPVTRLLAASLGLAAGCAAAKAGTVSVVGFTAGMPTGVVAARERGNAVLRLAGAAHAGTTTTALGDDDGSVGGSVDAAGIGIASVDRLGWAAHSRLQLGVFGDDHWFGEIDLEVGPGYLRRGKLGGGLTSGWIYSGFFDGSHAVPVRALAYLDLGPAVVHASAHVAWRIEDWDSRGAELGVALDRVHGLGGALRYHHQGDDDVVSLSVGWNLHTVGERNPGRPVSAPAPSAPRP